jgi:uncharacterized membrane protein HdeD (DUF308 family)
MQSEHITFRRFLRTMAIVIGIVLVWRGIWYLLDKLDERLFGGSHAWTAVIGVVLGLVILYLPNKNLKEIEKL